MRKQPCIKTYPIVYRLTSGWLCAIFFFIHCFVLPNPPKAFSSNAQTGIQENSLPAVFDASSASAKMQKITIPSGLGFIRYQNQQNPQKWVIHIQDAHAIGDAQYSIQKLIRYLTENFPVKNVMLEGAEGELDTHLLRSFPERNKIEKWLTGFLDSGELSGAAVEALLAGNRIRFSGMEKWKLYEDGIQTYLQALSEKELFLAQLAKHRRALESRKKRIFGLQLQQLDQLVLEWRRTHGNLPELLSALRETYPVDSEKFPHIYSLEMQEKESRQAAKETSRNLKSNLPWQKKIFAMRGFEFSEELERYLGEAESILYSNPKIKSVHAGDQTLILLEQFAKLELSYAGLKTLQQLKERGSALVKPLMEKYPQHQRFYRITFERDQVFLKRILERLNNPSSPEAIITVTGGFHGEVLQQSLEEKGISYLAIYPEIANLPVENHYSEYMKGNVSWKSYALNTNGEINLYDAFHRFAVQKLLAEDVSGVTGKQWRDQLLRELAGAGKLSQASFYTAYLDEQLKFKTGFLNSKEFSKNAFWQDKLDRFISGIKTLSQEKNLSPETVLQLARSSKTIHPEAVASFQRNATLEASRSELRYLVPPLTPPSDPNQILEEYSERIGAELNQAYLRMRGVFHWDNSISYTDFIDLIDFEMSNLYDRYRLNQNIPLTLAFKNVRRIMKHLPPEFQCCRETVERGRPSKSPRVGVRDNNFPWRWVYTFGETFDASLVLFGNTENHKDNISAGPAALIAYPNNDQYDKEGVNALRIVAKLAKNADDARKGPSSLRGASSTIIPRIGVSPESAMKDWTASLVSAGILGHHYMASKGPGFTYENMDELTQHAFRISVGQAALLKAQSKGHTLASTVLGFLFAPINLTAEHVKSRPEGLPLPPFLSVTPKLGGYPRDEWNSEGVAPMATLLALMRHPFIREKYFEGKNFLDDMKERNLRVGIFGAGVVAAQIVDELKANPAHDKVDVVAMISRDDAIYVEPATDEKPSGVDWGFLRDLVRLRMNHDYYPLAQLADDYSVRHPEILALRNSEVTDRRHIAIEKSSMDVMILAAPPHGFTAEEARRFKGKMVLEANPSAAHPEAIQILESRGILFIPYSTVNPGPAFAEMKELMRLLKENFKYNEQRHVLDGIIGYTVSNLWSGLDRLAERNQSSTSDAAFLREIVDNTNQLLAAQMSAELQWFNDLTSDWTGTESFERYRLDKTLGISEPYKRARFKYIFGRFATLSHEGVPLALARQLAVFELVYSDYMSGRLFGEDAAKRKFEQLLEQARKTDNQYRYLRRNAAYSLGQIIFLDTQDDDARKREAVEALNRLIQDPYPRVRLEAIKSSGNIRDERSIPSLMSRYLNPDEYNPGVQDWLDWSLVRLGNQIDWDKEIREKEEALRAAEEELARALNDSHQHREALRRDGDRVKSKAELEQELLAVYSNIEGVDTRKVQAQVSGMGMDELLNELIIVSRAHTSLQLPFVAMANIHMQLAKLYGKRKSEGDDEAKSQSYAKAVEFYQKAQIAGHALSAGSQLRLAEAYKEAGNPEEAKAALIHFLVPQMALKIFEGQRAVQVGAMDRPMEFYSFPRMALERLLILEGIFNERTAEFLADEFDDYLSGKSFGAVLERIGKKPTTLQELKDAEDLILEDIRASSFHRRVSIYEDYSKSENFYNLLVLLSSGIYQNFPDMERFLMKAYRTKKTYSHHGIKVSLPLARAQHRHVGELFEKLTFTLRSELRMSKVSTLDLTSPEIVDLGTAETQHVRFFEQFTRVRIQAHTQHSSRFIKIEIDEEGHLRTTLIGTRTREISQKYAVLETKLNTVNENAVLRKAIQDLKPFLRGVSIYLLQADENDQSRIEKFHPHLLTAVNRSFQLAYSDTDEQGQEKRIYLTLDAFLDFEPDFVARILAHQIKMAIAKHQAWHSGLSMIPKTEESPLVTEARKMIAVKRDLSAVEVEEIGLAESYQITSAALKALTMSLADLQRTLPNYGPAKTVLERAKAVEAEVEKLELNRGVSSWHHIATLWGYLTYEFHELAETAKTESGNLIGRDAGRMLEKAKRGNVFQLIEKLDAEFQKFVNDRGIYNELGVSYGQVVGKVIVVDDISKFHEEMQKAVRARQEGDNQEIIWVLPSLPTRDHKILVGEGLIVSMEDNQHAIDATVDGQAIPIAVIPNAVSLLKGYHAKTAFLRVLDSDYHETRFRSAYRGEKSIHRPKEVLEFRIPKARIDGDYFYRLSDIDENFLSFVGPKAASLGELIQAGENVPPGLALAYRFWYEYFNFKPNPETQSLTEKIAVLWKQIKTTEGNDEKGPEIDMSTEELDRILGEIKKLIMESEMPAYLRALFEEEVRKFQKDYGPVSFDMEELLRGLKFTYASKYNEQPVRARIRLKMPDEEMMSSSFIQVPRAAAISGVMKSVLPGGSDDRNKVDIVAARGQGWAVVGERGRKAHAIFDKVTGEVKIIEAVSSVNRKYVMTDTDFYYVRSSNRLEDLRWVEPFATPGYYDSAPDKNDVNAPTRKMEVTAEESSKEIINPDLATRLAAIAERLEAIYGYRPQDIEWLIDQDGVIWIVQDRAVKAGLNFVDKVIDGGMLDGIEKINFDALKKLRKAYQDKDVATLIENLQLSRTKREISSDKSSWTRRKVASEYLYKLSNEPKFGESLTDEQLDGLIAFYSIKDNLGDALPVSNMLNFFRNLRKHSSSPGTARRIHDYFQVLGTIPTPGLTHHVNFVMAEALIDIQAFEAAAVKLKVRESTQEPDIIDLMIRILGKMPLQYAEPFLNRFIAAGVLPSWTRYFAAKTLDRIVEKERRAELRNQGITKKTYPDYRYQNAAQRILPLVIGQVNHARTELRLARTAVFWAKQDVGALAEALENQWEQSLDMLIWRNSVLAELNGERVFDLAGNDFAQEIREGRISRFTPVFYYSPDMNTPLESLMRKVYEAAEAVGKPIKNFKFYFVVSSTQREAFRSFKTNLMRGGLQNLFDEIVMNENEAVSQTLVREKINRVLSFSGGKYGLFFIPETLAFGLDADRARQVSAGERVEITHAMTLIPSLSRLFASVETDQINAVSLKQAVPDFLQGGVLFNGSIQIQSILADLLVQARSEASLDISA